MPTPRASRPKATGPLGDVRVRLALNFAVDRAALFARSDESPGDVPFGFNPELSRRLLDDAGISKRLTIPVVTADEGLRKSAPFRATAAQLAKVGVNLRVEVASWDEWIARARKANGKELFHAGSGVFLGGLVFSGKGPGVAGVESIVRDVVELVASARPAAIEHLIATLAPAQLVFAAGTMAPAVRAPGARDQRRMRVWMRETGFESLVFLVAWWPGVVTASRTNYSGSISELVRDTLDDASDDNACFSVLEIMSHGGSDCIKLGSEWLRTSDFDSAGNPTTTSARRLLDALKRAMCPGGRLIFTACGQTTGSTLRNISRYINQAITVSGYSGTGHPPVAPGGVDDRPDQHYQNGSTASPP